MSFFFGYVFVVSIVSVGWGSVGSGVGYVGYNIYVGRIVSFS